MKIRLWLLLWCAFWGALQAQDYPDTATYAFPINHKVVLEIIPIDSLELKYHVLAVEEIEPGLDYRQGDSLFAEEEEGCRLVFYFGEGLGRPFTSVLVLRNYCDFRIAYQLAITDDPEKGFYATSVHPLFPRVISSELWQDPLKALLLHHLRRVN